MIHLQLDQAIVMQRITGRRIHPASGRTYHLTFHPPQQEGQDDITHEPLIQRKDDQAATVEHRLAVYQAQAEPLIEFYHQLKAKNHPLSPSIINIDASQSIESIQKQLYQQLSKDTHIDSHS